MIVGLGNIGDEYARTRHNIGFMVVDALASAGGVTFDDKRYGFVSTLKVKNQTLPLLKPSSYMNLSGNAVRYWMNELKVPVEGVLVLVDDLSQPFGHLRLKPSGSDGGHNGLKHIASVLGTQKYARLRFGIGNEFPRGGQVANVLGEFGEDDLKAMDERMTLEARFDKWLSAARIYNTRTLAADACKNGRGSINGAQAKPSRTVKAGDEVAVKKSPITYTFRVKQAIEKRVGAKLLPDVLENITKPEQYELLEMSRISGFVGRARGTGRPTKKDRRALDEFAEDTPVFMDDDFDFDED